MTATLEGSLAPEVRKGMNESALDTLRCFTPKGEKSEGPQRGPRSTRRRGRRHSCRRGPGRGSPMGTGSGGLTRARLTAGWYGQGGSGAEADASRLKDNPGMGSGRARRVRGLL